MEVWIAYSEHGAVHQDRVVIGVFTSKVKADNAAGKELRAEIRAGKVPYYNPRTREESVDWDIDTGTDGPFTLDAYVSSVVEPAKKSEPRRNAET
jgi:hypothetical protein